MGCSLCDFLWTHISDKCNRLNWSNEQTTPRCLRHMDVKSMALFVVVRQCHSFEYDCCKHLIPQTINVFSSSPCWWDSGPCSGVGLTLAVSWLWRGVGALQVRAVLALPSCQAGTELSSAAHSSVGLRTHNESDRNSDFPALLVSAVQSCPEDCSWGSGDRESLVEESLGSQCPGLGAAHPAPVPAAACSCFPEVQSQPRVIQLCSWTGIGQRVSFGALVLLTLMLSETQWNSCVPGTSTLYWLSSWCLFPYLVQAHAKRNAQNWYPW